MTSEQRPDCPICGADEPQQIERRDGAPVFLNRLGHTPEDASGIACGLLDVVGCRACGFVWNRAFEEEKVVYDSKYENDQTQSPAFQKHLQQMAQRILAAVPDEGPIDIVEVGCGQGAFLKALVSEAGPRLRSAIGFDPAFRSASSISDPRIRIFTEYFNDRTAALLERPPSLVLTRHTIEHVAHPLPFFSAIRKAIGRAGVRVFVETPDIDWIMQHQEVEDIFYEHCSLFGAESMAQALRSADFLPEHVETVFGGQYLLAEAVTTEVGVRSEPARQRRHEFPDLMRARQIFVEVWRKRIRDRSAVVWGAGAKGVTFATIVDPEGTNIAALVDINPGKQGKFLPITGHHVLPPEELPVLNPDVVVVMNPNYLKEISAMLVGMGCEADVLVLGDGAATAALHPDPA